MKTNKLLPFFLLFVLAGCGANGALTHARANETISHLVTAASGAVDVARRQQLDSVQASVEALPVEDQIRSVTRVHERWRVIGIANDALVSALRTHIEAVNADVAGADTTDTLLALLRPILNNYIWLRSLLEEASVAVLPEIPPFILTLAGGGR